MALAQYKDFVYLIYLVYLFILFLHFKGYLRYKTIFRHKVALSMQLMNFFI